MSTSLTELRALSEHTTQRLAENASADRTVTRAKRLLALTTALAEVDTVEDVAEVVLGIGLDVVEAARGFIGRAEGDRLRMIHAAHHVTHGTEHRGEPPYLAPACS